MVEEEGVEGDLPIKFASVVDRYYTRHYLKVRPSDLADCLKQQEPEIDDVNACLD